MDSRDYKPGTGREVGLQLLEARAAIEGTDDIPNAVFDLMVGSGLLSLQVGDQDSI